MSEELTQLRKENERLNRELPLMRKENRRLTTFIKDANAYINRSLAGNLRYEEILNTLCHDLGGLEKDEPCFEPRVSGYANYNNTNTTT